VVGGMGEDSDLSSVEIYTPSTQVKKHKIKQNGYKYGSWF